MLTESICPHAKSIETIKNDTNMKTLNTEQIKRITYDLTLYLDETEPSSRAMLKLIYGVTLPSGKRQGVYRMMPDGISELTEMWRKGEMKKCSMSALVMRYTRHDTLKLRYGNTTLLVGQNASYDEVRFMVEALFIDEGFKQKHKNDKLPDGPRIRLYATTQRK